jgi:hypothetical protein
MQVRLLFPFFLVLAVIGLVLTWSQNLVYLGPGAGPGGMVDFLKDTVVNPGARSIAFDMLIVGWALSVWMVVEGRRRRMRWVWFYPLVGWSVAMAFTVPLFLAMRERALRTSPEIEGRPGILDGVGLGLVSAFVLVMLVLGVRASGLI